MSHAVMGPEGNLSFTLSNDMHVVFRGKRDYEDISPPYALHQMLIQQKGFDRAIVTIELKPALSRYTATMSQLVIAEYWQAVIEYIALGHTSSLKANASHMINYILIAGRQLIPLLRKRKLIS